MVKHEAMAIRRARLDSVDRDDVDLDTSVHGGLREVEDEVAGGERVERSVEALRALKPDEARALLLKAEGLSYQEIGKPLRLDVHEGQPLDHRGPGALPEGLLRGIEAGEECEAHEATLTALAAGDGDERRGGLDPPAPAPLRDVPRGGARHALLAHAAARAAAAVRLAGAAALALGRDDTMYSASTGGGRLRAGRGAARALPERRSARARRA